MKNKETFHKTLKINFTIDQYQYPKNAMAADMNGRTVMTTVAKLSDTSESSDVGADRRGDVDSFYNMNETFEQYSIIIR